MCSWVTAQPLNYLRLTSEFIPVSLVCACACVCAHVRVHVSVCVSCLRMNIHVETRIQSVFRLGVMSQSPTLAFFFFF